MGGLFFLSKRKRNGSEKEAIGLQQWSWGQRSSLGGPVAIPSWLGTAVPDKKALILLVKKRLEKLNKNLLKREGVDLWIRM